MLGADSSGTTIADPSLTNDSKNHVRAIATLGLLSRHSETASDSAFEKAIKGEE